jgi:serine/threonine protein kinase
LAKQIAAGLEAAHTAGIVHRDLKPDNILIEKTTNIVRIADFGIAKHSSSSGLTVSDKVAGTPAYMSPEQTGGEKLDARSDLFSLGSVLVAAATGLPPFGLEHPFVVMDRIRNQEAASLKSLRPDFPEWFSEIVEHLLTKDKASRTASAEELLRSLFAHEVPSSPIGIPRIEIKHSKKSPIIPSLVFAASITAIALVALAIPIFIRDATGTKHADESSSDPKTQSPIQPNANTSIGSSAPTKLVWNRRSLAEFNDLSSAIESASDGDTIEITGDLECEPISVHTKNLTLKGSAAKRPVLRSKQELRNQSDAYFIRTEFDLTVDGIEIDWKTRVQAPLFDERIINAVVASAPGTRMIINDCKISRNTGGVCVVTGGNLDVRNSLIQGADISVVWLGLHTHVTIQDSVLNSRIGVTAMYPRVNTPIYSMSDLKLKNCIIRAEDAVCVTFARKPDKPIRIELEDCIVDAVHAVSLLSTSNIVREQLESQPTSVFHSSIEWHESRCIYDSKCEHVVTRRIKNVDRKVNTVALGHTQWLGLLETQPMNAEAEAQKELLGESRSIAVKMIRTPTDVDAFQAPAYQFEPINDQPLPSWINEIGPRDKLPDPSPG